MVNKMNRKNKLILQFGVAILVIASNSEAAKLDLTSEPLFLDQSVKPALALTMDDSGSMAWGVMPDSITGGWNNIEHDYVSVASSSYNTIYYDPDVEYRLPIKPDGTLARQHGFRNAAFNGYRIENTGQSSDGNDCWSTYDSSDCKLDMLWDLDNHYKMVWRAGAKMYDNSISGYQLSEAGKDQTNSGRSYNWDRAFYYTWNGPANASMSTRKTATRGSGLNHYTLHWVSPSEEQNFANWFSYYKTRTMLAKASLSYAFYDFGPEFKIDWQQLNYLHFGSTPNMELFDGPQRDKFYEWIFEGRGWQGSTPLRKSLKRVAENVFSKGAGLGSNSPYFDDDFGIEISCQQNFHIQLTDGGWNTDDAPGIDEDDDDDGKEHTFPDGTNYKPADFPMKLYMGNESGTLADNAFAYWRQDLRTDLDNKVPRYIEDYTDRTGANVPIPTGKQWWEIPSLYWNPKNDPANWQHMVNFNIGIGVKGSLNPDVDLPNLRSGAKPWPSPYVTGGKTDDAWHAAINSRGRYLSAKNPTQLASSLRKIIKNIITRKGRASAGSVSSNVISDNSLFFKVGYDSSNWSGSIEAREILEDGSIGSQVWEAATLLDAKNPASRTIITYDPNSTALNKTVPFKVLSMLSSDYKNDLLKPNVVSEVATITGNSIATVLQNIIDYIRGDRSLEGTVFRERKTVLGDMIFATPVVVRGPSATYDDDNWQPGTPEDSASFKYNDYRMAYRDRDNIILAGANDGMMHAFGAGIKNTSTGGEELWAYIPREVVKNIAKLADPDYLHTSYVDGSPYVKDVFINNNWTTVALGGLRKGGKAFYALNLGSDLTNTPTALWEFDGDNDMGYTYSGGVISRVYNPNTGGAKWVAFLPNGYDSDTNRSAMYAVDMENGALLHKWVTGIGNSTDPNGMGPPVVSDFMYYTDPSNPSSITFGQSDQSADYVYAGDLHGNLYRFNALDVFSPGTTNADILFDGSKDQPITTAPRIFTANDSDASIVITFGTGKYIELPDKSINIADQYVVGIRDKYGAVSVWNGLGDSRLVEQGIISQVIDSATKKGYRTISDNTVNSNQGWKLRLKNPSLSPGDLNGERMVNAMLRDNQNKILTFVTIIPKGLDPCLSGVHSWIMSIDPISGAKLPDGYFTGGNDGVYIDDIAFGMNIVTSLGGNSSYLTVDTGGYGDIGDTISVNIPQKSWGRRSWHRTILE